MINNQLFALEKLAKRGFITRPERGVFRECGSTEKSPCSQLWEWGAGRGSENTSCGDDF